MKHFSLNILLQPALYVLRNKMLAFLVLCAFITLNAESSYGSTRYRVSAVSIPTGPASFCQGSAASGYSCTPTGASCFALSGNTCTVTWQWLLDGSNVAGASGSFVASSNGTLAAVTLSAAQANTFPAGAHTLQCRFTSSVTNCSATNPLTSGTLNITVNAPPAAVTVAGGGTVCGSTTLTASGGSPGTIYWQNTTTNGTSTTTAISSQSISTAGTYYFRSRTAAGCWGTQGSASVSINPLPNLSNFSINATSPCHGASSTATILSSSVGNGTYTITYNLTGANSVTGATASVTMASGSGTFTIPSGSLGNTGSTTVTITNVRNALLCNAAPGSGNSAGFTVNALPTAVTVSGAGTFCEATVLSASGGTGGAIYFQNTTSNGVSTATASDLELILTSGTYYFRAQSPAGCWGTQGSAAVVINPAPTAVSVSGGGTYCNSATLTATGGTGGTIYFQGTTSNGTSTATAGASQSVTASGTYYFRSQTAAGCWGAEGSTTVTINSSPNVSIFSTSATSLCTGNSSAVTVNSSSLASGTYTVTYNLSGANIQTGSTTTLTMSGGTGTFSIPSGVLASNGSTTITITSVQNALSCSSTPGSGNTATFSVSALPAITDISASVSELCVGTGITFTATGVTGPGSPTSFNWVGPNTYSDATATNSTSFTAGSTSASGIYTVTVTYPGTGCISAQAVTAAAVTVNALPSVANITPSETELCVGNNFTLTANSVSGTGTPSFAWSGPGSYSSTTAIDNATVAASSVAYAGSYSLTITYPGAGCTTSQVVSAPVAVNEVPTIAGVTASSSTLCVGSNLTLTAGAVTGTGTPSYAWSGPNGFTTNTSIDNTTLNVTTTAATGSYSVVVTYPGLGCSTGLVSTSAITVNNAPTIAGITPSSTTLCEGANLTLTAGAVTGTGSPSYNWSGPNGFGTVTAANNTSLAVSTADAGVYSVNVTYPGTGCGSSTVTSAAITVNTLPVIGSITASSATLCVGADITFTANSVSGTGSPIFNWSGPDSYADATTTNNASFTTASTAATGSYSVIVTYPGTGCTSAIAASSAVNVNPLPTVASITPSAAALCEGTTLTLTAGAVTGTGIVSSYNWNGPDSYTQTTTGNATSLVVASTAASGNYSLTVTYPGTGCTSTFVDEAVIVNPLPAAITGLSDVCVNATVDLDNADAGGTWTSDDDAFATVDADGIVLGIAAGNVDINYTLSTGCSRAYPITVNALPAAITGDLDVCDGLTTTLTSASSGGTWVCDDAFINVAGGILVTGTGAGTAAVTYTLGTGCQTTAVLTVFALPDPITGIAPVCEQETIILSNTTTGGSWSTSDDAIADIAASTGALTGIEDGNATITYTSTDGCITTIGATVNVTPGSITGTTNVCVGLVTDLDNPTAGGAWTSGTTGVGTINAGTGEVTGITDGTTEITYALGTGCKTVQTVTVNPLPATIAGSDNVCQGFTTTLTNTSVGGTWHSSAISTATIGSISGTVSGELAGNVDITYTLPTGCISTMPFTVNALPAAITGTFSACQGASSAMDDPGTAGTWASSHPTFATIDAAGNVDAIAAGNTTITYTLPTGCKATQEYTVHPLPSAYTGAVQICENVSGVLNNTLTGGTWLSGDNTIADVTAAGNITGMTAGTTNVTYTLATGCNRIETVTVDPAVPAITGAGEVCQNLTLTLGNTEAGGTWTSNLVAIATAGASDGVVTGIAAGSSIITYTLPTGCFTTENVTVNALPAAITGTMQVCAGLTTTLGNVTPDGTWSGGASGIGTIDASGMVTGIAEGNVPVTYKLIATGCERNATIAVNPLPVAQTVTGGGAFCADASGVHIGLSNSIPGINYTLKLGATNVHTMLGVNTPLDYGLITTAGTYTVHAVNITTGCINNMTGSATVNITPMVTPVVTISSSHGDTVCAGTNTTFTATPVNGGVTPVYQWMVNTTVVSAASSYVYTPLNGDIVKVMLTSSEVCPSPANVNALKSMTVIDNQTPTISIAKTSSDTVCQFDIATFTAMQTWGGDAPVLTWLRNGSAVGSGASLAYLPVDGDIISCRLASNFRCRLATTVTSSGITMDVDSVYVPSVSISAEPGLVVSPATTVTLIATVDNAGPTPFVMWFINGMEQPGEYTATLKRHFNNGDEVKCMVFGTGICGLPSFNSIIMTVDPTLSVGNYSTTIGDIKLAPNPNNGRFTVSTSVNGAVNETVDIAIINTLGQSVYTGQATVRNGQMEKTIQLDGAFANGVYMLRIKSGAEHKVIPFLLNQ